MPANRAYESWEAWENELIQEIVVSPANPYLVHRAAHITQRTVNAILCRIEKVFGTAVRRHIEGLQMTPVTQNPAHVFWLCWVKGERMPEVQHLSLSEAHTEAKRLCGKTGRRVYVLQTIGYMEPPQQPTAEWHDL